MVARLCLGGKRGCPGSWDVAHDRRSWLFLKVARYLWSLGLRLYPMQSLAMLTLTPPARVLLVVTWTKGVNGRKTNEYNLDRLARTGQTFFGIQEVLNAGHSSVASR